MANTKFKPEVRSADLTAQIQAIREALHIGLASFGEIERVADFHEILEASGYAVHSELKPIHPTGSANTVSVFAGALRTLDSLEIAKT